jgi:hypothetical protein
MYTKKLFILRYIISISLKNNGFAIRINWLIWEEDYSLDVFVVETSVSSLGVYCRMS